MIVYAHELQQHIQQKPDKVKFFGNDYKIELHPDSRIAPPFDCIAPINDLPFPGQQKLFIDYLLLEGKFRLIDYSLLLSDSPNFNISYDLFLNVRRQMFMNIKQFSNRDCFYICDGMTHKKEFCWLIFENKSKEGKPKLFTSEMQQYTKEIKAQSFHM
jgi:hypothetical protein